MKNAKIVRTAVISGIAAIAVAAGACVPPPEDAPVETTTTLTSVPPGGHTPLSLTCRAVAGIIQRVNPMENGAVVLGPETVGSGDEFTVSVTLDPIDVPTVGDGFPIVGLYDYKVNFKIPEGTELVSATWSGGANLGAGLPTIAATSGGVVTLSTPGPFAPGTSVVLPTVELTLTATAAPGSLVAVSLAGSSYADPTMRFVAKADVLGNITDGTTTCYLPVNPVLATIEVV